MLSHIYLGFFLGNMHLPGFAAVTQEVMDLSCFLLPLHANLNWGYMNLVSWYSSAWSL